MIINKDTEMLLFRFSNYKRHSFINEHLSLLNNTGYVWMMKLGKRSSIEKINDIKENGGWLVLRSPKADGSKSYLAKFTDVIEVTPKDGVYPEYYHELFNGIDEGNLYYVNDPSFQWFRIELIEPLDNITAGSLVVSKTGKKVDDVINTTRTAVMFIKNEVSIEA